MRPFLFLIIPPLQGRADSGAAAAEPGGVMARSAIFCTGMTPPRCFRTRPSPEGEGWGAIDESYTSMKTLPSSTMAG